MAGNIQHIKSFHSTVLSNDRNITVYLPPGYESNRKTRYPVLYMHDGQNVFDGTTSFLPNKEWRADETAEGLIRAHLIEPLIIVAIDNAGADRANEFLPTRSPFGKAMVGGNADLYGKMLCKEIMPMIDKTYRTKKGPQNTGVCGSSFGGVLSLHLGITHPEIFGRIGVVSPSVWWDNRVLLREVGEVGQKPTQKIWLDIGTHEGDNDAENRATVDDTTALFDLLVKKGWKPGADLAYFVDQDARHNEDAWAHRMPMILMFLFPSR
ncbi:MAG: alpha/beta hydrolase-fold protein [Fimbriimonas sp.]|nr:alpha/beta hydrolase-fold protein [Fimbriimonas sp.]